MSKLTDYLKKPMSETTDIAVSALVGAAVFIVLKAVPDILPLQDAFEVGLAGSVAAAFYIRARNNLTKAPPQFPE